jgi:hypothetical protein
MSTSIRNKYCQNCGDYTPHNIFSSFVGKILKCLVCNTERVEELENDKNFRK